jgi:ribosomal protein S18 acetylase RimI-like enzyme
MQGITIKPVRSSEEKRITQMGAFVKVHSWGEDFPLDAGELLRKAEFIFAAFQNRDEQDVLVGLICGTRSKGCPDDYNDKKLYICCWVVHQDLRGRGVGKELYDKTINFVRGRRYFGSELFATVDSEQAKRALTKRILQSSFGSRIWKKIRDGENEDGSPFELYRLNLR